jgi:hypothetical protein
MIHSLLAVFGGFAAMALIVMMTTALAAHLLVPGGMRATATPGLPLPPAYLGTNLAGSAVAAFIGGALTARIAGHDPMIHGGALAMLMALMSVASARQYRGLQPRWYQLTLMTAMPAIALAGAWVGGSWGAAS